MMSNRTKRKLIMLNREDEIEGETNNVHGNTIVEDDCKKVEYRTEKAVVTLKEANTPVEINLPTLEYLNIFVSPQYTDKRLQFLHSFSF